MARAFEDQEAVARILESGDDPAIYTSHYPDIPNEPGHLAFLTTIISLGTVGSEFYMTKGHHHHRDSAELYIGLSGQGIMIMESRGGGTSPSRSWCHRRLSMSPGVGPSRGQ
jgi:glucose-6-phosphate isomerase